MPTIAVIVEIVSRLTPWDSHMQEILPFATPKSRDYGVKLHRDISKNSVFRFLY